jgi:hypothetical protein
MKIFEIKHSDGEKEWISGRTLIHALSHYVNTTDCHLSEMEDSHIEEVNPQDWGRYKVDDGGTIVTFRTWMRHNSEHAEIITGTMYD